MKPKNHEGVVAMAISLTERAAERIKKQLLKRGRGLGLRLGVKKGGCSGYSYSLDYADEIGPEDVVFESYGVKVVVSRRDLELLDGLEIDYRREGLNEAFRFHHPRAKATCGCGESFTV